jgi:hypothetical protein
MILVWKKNIYIMAAGEPVAWQVKNINEANATSLLSAVTGRRLQEA